MRYVPWRALFVGVVAFLAVSTSVACELNTEEFRWFRGNAGGASMRSAHITVEGTMKIWTRRRGGKYGTLHIKGYLDGKWIGNVPAIVMPDGSFHASFLDQGHLVKPASKLEIKITCG